MLNIILMWYEFIFFFFTSYQLSVLIEYFQISKYLICVLIYLYAGFLKLLLWPVIRLAKPLDYYDHKCIFYIFIMFNFFVFDDWFNLTLLFKPTVLWLLKDIMFCSVCEWFSLMEIWLLETMSNSIHGEDLPPFNSWDVNIFVNKSHPDQFYKEFVSYIQSWLSPLIRDALASGKTINCYILINTQSLWWISFEPETIEFLLKNIIFTNSPLPINFYCLVETEQFRFSFPSAMVLDNNVYLRVQILPSKQFNQIWLKIFQ